MDAFERLAPFIQNYIYRNNWEELHANQVAACEVIFDSDDNLLLSSGTASGKTEAAFLPVLTQLYNAPSASVGVLYISPLKALINDQFKRLEQLLEDSHIAVTRWHGDASATRKNRLIRHPEGILQITPESLEGLLTNRRGACLAMFSDLRFVIIDEVHYFMRDARGIQLLCVLERLKKLTGVNPRRIGLSATLGDLTRAQDWLNTGTGRGCAAPVSEEGKRRIRLFVERFVNDGEGNGEGERAQYEYLFRQTLDKKTIIFANSREEIEYVMANLRQIAAERKAPDVYRVHHGNVSALLRENTEDEMKSEEEKIVTGATVTLELGIDIGSLDQVIQIGAPLTVSSFAQRLGRCGRRGQVPQLLFTFVESVKVNPEDVLGPVNWSFLRIIAIIELYVREHWVEPILPQRHVYHLLYHQTMSCLKGNGEMSAAALAQTVLTLESFRHISQEEYKKLLAFMLETEQIQRTERGGLIIGRAGEKVVNSYQFLTVFTAPQYYLVKEENRTIGTVDKPYRVGIRFALAGMSWETVDINEQSKVIFVKRVPGISVVDWNVEFEAEIHTVVAQKIRSILKGEELYPYLSERCKDRLRQIRYITGNSGLCDRLVSPLSGQKYAVFPWVGTRQLVTLHYLLLQRGIKNQLPFDGCLYLEVLFDGGAEALRQVIADILQSGADLYALPLPDKVQVEGKYNPFVPQELLRRQFIEDYLDLKGLMREITM